MKLALFGATGLTGRALLQQALDAKHQIVAYARNPADLPAAPGLEVVQGDQGTPKAMVDAVRGAGEVLSCLGSRTLKRNTVRSEAARNLIAAMKEAAVKRLVWLSAAGVGDSREQSKRSSWVFGNLIIPLMLKHVYADGAMADELLGKSGLDFTVVRPVGLNNKERTGKVLTLTDGSKIPALYISRADVAAWMLDAAVNSRHVGQMPVICWA